MSELKATPVYPEFVRETVRFQLYSDGTVMVRTRDIEPRELCTLSNSDDGTPWIPSHRNFNSLCRQMFREGDVDDLAREQDRISKARGLKRKHGVELYDALENLLKVHEGEGGSKFHAGNIARAALAKARGEQS